MILRRVLNKQLMWIRDEKVLAGGMEVYGIPPARPIGIRYTVYLIPMGCPADTPISEASVNSFSSYVLRLEMKLRLIRYSVQ